MPRPRKKQPAYFTPSGGTSSGGTSSGGTSSGGTSSGGAARPVPPVQPVPGSRARPPEGVRTYIVTMKDEAPAPATKKPAAHVPRGTGAASSPPPGRREMFERGLARSSSFQERLAGWLENEGVPEDSYSFGEVTAFPAVFITTTPEVAEKLERMPAVDVVVEDAGLRLLR